MLVGLVQMRADNVRIAATAGDTVRFNAEPTDGC